MHGTGRLASLGLALVLLAGGAVSLVGVARVLSSADAVARTAVVESAGARVDRAITTLGASVAAYQVAPSPAVRARHADVTADARAALAVIDGGDRAEDRSTAATAVRLLDAHRAAADRVFAAVDAGDRAGAAAVDRAELRPGLAALDGWIAAWADRHAIDTASETARLRAEMADLLTVAAPVVVASLGLLVVLVVVVARQRRSLAHQSDLTARQALHDPLTGLPNRTLLTERLDRALAGGRRDGTSLAVMLLDLDRFKDVNDTLGHHYGDELLRQISARLTKELRETDTVARMSGDEFALLLPGADRAVAGQLAERVLARLHRSFTIHDVAVDVEASVGVALAPAHGEAVKDLMRAADVALGMAKEAKNGIVLYEPSTATHQPSRLLLLGQLRRALDDPDQLILHYQPKVSLDAGGVCGVEALLRWQHPTRGMVPPAEFIPVAESTGLINQLTMHVLNLAMGQARSWMDAGIEVPVAVNLSPRCLLDAALLDRIRDLLATHGVPPRLLRLEVTETAVMANPALAMSTLTGLHELGVRLSIDDFGTGYSSMAYLRRLPVDELKVDRSFVLNMTDNDSDAILVRSAIDLGHNLGLSVVAEGVERADHVDALSELSCDIAQGYHYARPMPPGELETWMVANGFTGGPAAPARSLTQPRP